MSLDVVFTLLDGFTRLSMVIILIKILPTFKELLKWHKEMINKYLLVDNDGNKINIEWIKNKCKKTVGSWKNY